MKTILPILRKTLSINTLIVVLSLVIYSIGVNATVRYVKPIATGFADGSSWDNASDDIQTMIITSAPNDSVWVAAGEYKPNSYPPLCIGCENSRHYTFYVKDGIRLFGNFDGTETDIAQRDFSGNTTFLSGDLNDDDEVSGSFINLEITNNNENVYHVVLASDISSGNLPVTIDGFTIKGGNANNTFNCIVNGFSVTMKEGGGIYIVNQQIIIRNCFIVNNSASYGGGISCYSQNTIVSNNIISSNISLLNGGGINFYNTMGQILNNSIIGNLASNNGGAIYSTGTNNEIGNNEIIGNATENHGGGLFLLNGENEVYHNVITNNYAVNNGGAIFHDTGITNISKNIIAYNTAGINGGGIHISTSISSVINNVIYNNTVETSGGGLYIGNSTITLTNNTIARNASKFSGGGIHVINGTNSFTNNIFWDNNFITETAILSSDLFLVFGLYTFQNNILQLDSTSYTGSFYNLGANAEGNLFAQNPLFLDFNNPTGEDSFYFTGDDGLRLQTNSPALNAGTDINAPVTDILGTIRDDQPDIGAYEHGVAVGIQPNTDSQPAIVLNAYPNPATDVITFTFTTPVTDNSTLLLYAIDGQNITTLYKATTQAGQTNTLTIDTKAFTPGTYCAVLRCGNGLAQHRTIIIK